MQIEAMAKEADAVYASAERRQEFNSKRSFDSINMRQNTSQASVVKHTRSSVWDEEKEAASKSKRDLPPPVLKEPFSLTPTAHAMFTAPSMEPKQEHDSVATHISMPQLIVHENDDSRHNSDDDLPEMECISELDLSSCTAGSSDDINNTTLTLQTKNDDFHVPSITNVPADHMKNQARHPTYGYEVAVLVTVSFIVHVVEIDPLATYVLFSLVIQIILFRMHHV